MIEVSRDAVVLKPSGLGEAGEVLRRRLNRRHLMAAVGIALLFHLLIVFGFWLVDRIRVQDIGEWSGPVLVKIGVQDAADSPAVDPGPLPDQPEVSEQPVPPKESQPETASETIADNSTPLQPVTSTDSTRPEESQPEAESSVAQNQPALPPQPSRVKGEENGNSYEMNFDGTEGDVGLTMRAFFIDYMPLPELLGKSLIDNLTVPEGSKYVTRDSVLGDLLVYWKESFNGDYVKKEYSGTVPLKDRPYYWSLLRNNLNYDSADADWRTPNMRPVVIEFTVEPSVDELGAKLTEVKLINHTDNPKIDDAILYGMMNGVFYNKTEKQIHGKLTYRFQK